MFSSSSLSWGFTTFFYGICFFLLAIMIRLLFAWIIAERAYMIAHFKGYDKSEVKVDKLAIFVSLLFGAVICFFITLFFVHSLPNRR